MPSIVSRVRSTTSTVGAPWSSGRIAERNSSHSFLRTLLQDARLPRTPHAKAALSCDFMRHLLIGRRGPRAVNDFSYRGHRTAYRRRTACADEAARLTRPGPSGAIRTAAGSILRFARPGFEP